MKKRYLKSILLISLLLNIFLMGLVSAPLLHKPQRRFMKKEFEKVLQPDVLKEHKKEMRQARRNLKKILREEPFNPEKVSVAFSELEKTRQKFHQLIQKKLISKSLEK